MLHSEGYTLLCTWGGGGLVDTEGEGDTCYLNSGKGMEMLKVNTFRGGRQATYIYVLNYCAVHSLIDSPCFM